MDLNKLFGFMMINIILTALILIGGYAVWISVGWTWVIAIASVFALLTNAADKIKHSDPKPTWYLLCIYLSHLLVLAAFCYRDFYITAALYLASAISLAVFSASINKRHD